MSGGGGTHVRWAFRLAGWNPVSKDQIRKAFARIQSEEVERLMKFMFLDDLKASLVGRLLIRNFLVGATGLANPSIVVQRDGRGKPYFPGDHNLDFNVSHQGGFAVLAGWYDGTTKAKGDQKRLRVGIDVMKMEYTGGKSIPEFFRLMDRNFTAGEWRYIKGGGSRQELISRFMRVWCLKESYVKNVGVGITVDLRLIDFLVTTPLSKVVNELNCTTRVRLSNRDEADDNWHFEETRLDEEDHCVAVSVNVPPSGVAYKESGECFRFIDIQWLIDNIDPLRDEAEISEDLCSQVLRKDVK